MNKKLSFALLLSGVFVLMGCGQDLPKQYDTVLLRDLNGGGTYEASVLKGGSLRDLPCVKLGCNVDYYLDSDDNRHELDEAVGSVSKDLVLRPVYSVNPDTFTRLSDNASELTPESKLRVMSYNVLSNDWNNKPQMHGYDEHNEKYPSGVDDGRDVQNKRTIMAYMPDVVGVQEFDDEFYSVMKKFHDEDDFPYRVVNESEKQYTLNGQKQTIYTTLMYNEDRVTLRFWKHTRFKTADTNVNCRSYTYALFTINETGEEFVALSSHWNHLDSSKPDTPTKEQEQAIETANVYKELEQKFDCPIIAVGDMNQIDSHPSIATLVDESGFVDAKYSASHRGICCDTYHIGNGDASEPGKWYRGIDSVLPELINTDEARDHIYISKDVTSKYYTTVTTEDALNSSDHMPIFADLAF